MLKELRNEGNIVKICKIGNATVKICDDECKDKTNEDVQAILERIRSIGIRAVKK